MEDTRGRFEGPENKQSLGQLRQASRARSDSERRSRYFLLVQTQRNYLRHESYVKVQNDGAFINACQRAGVEPTVRQAAKWLQKRGAAWNAR